MEDKMEKLKSCPFCGSRDIVIDCNTFDYGNDYFAICNNLDCLAEGPARATNAKAIDAWNMRTENDGQPCKYFEPEYFCTLEAGIKSSHTIFDSQWGKRDTASQKDEGDYVTAARKKTFEKLEPLRKALLKIVIDEKMQTKMEQFKEAHGLLEQAITTLEMIYNIGGDLVTKDELLFGAIKNVSKAQDLIETGALINALMD